MSLPYTHYSQYGGDYVIKHTSPIAICRMTIAFTFKVSTWLWQDRSGVRLWIYDGNGQLKSWSPEWLADASDTIYFTLNAGGYFKIGLKGIAFGTGELATSYIGYVDYGEGVLLQYDDNSLEFIKTGFYRKTALSLLGWASSSYLTKVDGHTFYDVLSAFSIGDTYQINSAISTITVDGTEKYVALIRKNSIDCLLYLSDSTTLIIRNFTGGTSLEGIYTSLSWDISLYTVEPSAETRNLYPMDSVAKVGKSGLKFLEGWFETINVSNITSESSKISSDKPFSLPSLEVASKAAYSCRAWVKFNGAGTVSIMKSENVSSIIDYGTGYYGVNFTTAMSDANYAVNATSISTVSTGSSLYMASVSVDSSPTTTSVRILIKCTYDGAMSDSSTIFVSIFR